MEDLNDFLAAFRAGDEAKKVALFLVEWMRKGGYEEPRFGTTSIIAQIRIGSDTKNIFGIDTRGIFYLCLDHRGRNIDINRMKPFTKARPERKELFNRLKAIGFKTSPKAMDGNGSPSIKLEKLQQDERMTKFTEMLDWLVTEMENHAEDL